MKQFLLAGAAVAAFAVSPALAQQAIVRGDSEQARSQISQTQPLYQQTYGGGYVATYGGVTGYAPQGYVAAGPYASTQGYVVAGPYASSSHQIGTFATPADYANPNVVVSIDGRVAGEDPDPAIRSELQRSAEQMVGNGAH